MVVVVFNSEGEQLRISKTIPDLPVGSTRDCTIDVKYTNKGVLKLGGGACFFQNIPSHFSLKENISPLCFRYWIFWKRGVRLFL